MPNSAQTKTTGPSRPSTGDSGRARSSSSTCASRAIRSPSARRRPRPRGVRREVGELANGVAAVDLPGKRVERAEERRPIGIPRPAVVEGNACERGELGRQPPGQVGGALVSLPGTRQRGDVDDPRGAHGGQASRGGASRASATRCAGSARSSPRRRRRASSAGTGRCRARSRPPRARAGTGALAGQRDLRVRDDRADRRHDLLDRRGRSRGVVDRRAVARRGAARRNARATSGA